MSESVSIWLFGVFGVWCVALTLALARFHMMVSRIQMAMVITSKRAAEILHSPDDHLGIDQLLDNYISGHHDLPNEEWEVLKNKCNEIANDPSKPKSERMLAMFVVELAVHKLTPKFPIATKPEIKK